MPRRLNACCALLLAAEAFVDLHGPAGQHIYVNPGNITSIREPTFVNRHYVAKGTRCVLFMVNGNFIATTETCNEVRAILER
jgi:hypothetical protein